MDYQIKKLTNEQIDKLIIDSKWKMNSLCLRIPYCYVSKTIKLSWSDILFAIENGFFSPQAAVDFAVTKIENGENYTDFDLSMASLTNQESQDYDLVRDCIFQELKDVYPEDILFSKEKILYVVLSWLFDKKDCFDDALGAVAIVYDDFGAPENMVGFVKYMPIDEQFSGSVESGEEKLFKNWSIYLEKQKIKYSSL